MLTAEGKTREGRLMRPAPAPRSRRILRRIGTFALLAGWGLVLAVAWGFAVFASHVPTREVTLTGEADGIVALTGGASRIADAIGLIAAGHGKRLLISGANPATNAHEISRLHPEFEQWVRCCVEFDRSVNTLGNAIEIRNWAERSGLKSLVVVTSNYHMPRALAEIRHQLPEIMLVPFPVVADWQRAGPWWSNPMAVRLMLSEYMKLMLARVRMALHPGAQARESA